MLTISLALAAPCNALETLERLAHDKDLEVEDVAAVSKCSAPAGATPPMGEIGRLSQWAESGGTVRERNERRVTLLERYVDLPPASLLYESALDLVWWRSLLQLESLDADHVARLRGLAGASRPVDLDVERQLLEWVGQSKEYDSWSGAACLGLARTRLELLDVAMNMPDPVATLESYGTHDGLLSSCGEGYAGSLKTQLQTRREFHDELNTTLAKYTP